MTEEERIQEEILTEAKALARAAGLNPNAIAEIGEPEPVLDDRGDGVFVTQMRRPLRPRWTEFVDEARRRVAARNGGR
jgi:hypothetical protein